VKPPCPIGYSLRRCFRGASRHTGCASLVAKCRSLFDGVAIGPSLSYLTTRAPAVTGSNIHCLALQREPESFAPMAETTTHTAADSQTPSTHSSRNLVLSLIGLIIAGGLIWYLLAHGGAGNGGAGNGGAANSGAGNGGAANSGAAKTSRANGRPTATVGVATAELADVPVYLSAIGSVQPVVVATVRPQLAGTLFSIDFDEGQMVSKGQLLAQIDPRPYKLALSQAEGMLSAYPRQVLLAFDSCL